MKVFHDIHVADCLGDIQALTPDDVDSILVPLNLKLGTRRRVAAQLLQLQISKGSSSAAADVAVAVGVDTAGAAGTKFLGAAGAASLLNTTGNACSASETAAARRRRQRRARDQRASGQGADDPVKKWNTGEIESWIRETCRLANSAAEAEITKGSCKNTCIEARSAVIQQRWELAEKFVPEKLHAELQVILHEL